MASSINDIIGECYMLKILSLDAFTVHGYTPSTPFTINESIEEVILTRCGIIEETLPMLSLRLPSLKFLELNAIISYGKDYWDCDTFIDMPNTHIENINWTGDHDHDIALGYTKIYLKVTSGNGSKYFVLDGEGRIAVSPDIEYSEKDAITDEDDRTKLGVNYHIMHIRCKDVETIIIQSGYKCINESGITDYSCKSCYYDLKS